MKILKVAVALGLATSLSGCLSDDVVDGAIDPIAALSLYERWESEDATPADPDALPSTVVSQNMRLAPTDHSFGNPCRQTL